MHFICYSFNLRSHIRRPLSRDLPSIIKCPHDSLSYAQNYRHVSALASTSSWVTSSNRCCLIQRLTSALRLLLQLISVGAIPPCAVCRRRPCRDPAPLLQVLEHQLHMALAPRSLSLRSVTVPRDRGTRAITARVPVVRFSSSEGRHLGQQRKNMQQYCKASGCRQRHAMMAGPPRYAGLARQCGDTVTARFRANHRPYTER